MLQGWTTKAGYAQRWNEGCDGGGGDGAVRRSADTSKHTRLTDGRSLCGRGLRGRGHNDDDWEPDGREIGRTKGVH